MPAQRHDFRRSLRISNQERQNYSEDVHESATSSVKAGKIIPTYFPFMNPRLPYPINTLSDHLDALPGHLLCPPHPTAISTTKQRISHSHRKPEGHISRPPNAFMLFRSDFWATEKNKEMPIERDHRCISRIVAHCWKNVDSVTKARYEELANHLRNQHRLRYPDYKFTPTARSSKQIKKSKKNKADEERRCRELASLVMGGVHESITLASEAEHSSRPNESFSEQDSVDHSATAAFDHNGGRTPRRKEHSTVPAESTCVWQEAGQPQIVRQDEEGKFIQPEGIQSSPTVLSAEQILHKPLVFYPAVQHPLYEAIDTPFGSPRLLQDVSGNINDFWYTSDGVLREDDSSAYYGLGVDFLPTSFGSIFPECSELDFLHAVAAGDYLADSHNVINPDINEFI